MSVVQNEALIAAVQLVANKVAVTPAKRVADYMRNYDTYEEQTDGDKVIADVESTLDELYAAGEEFYVQKLCHRYMLRQCIPSIYGRRDFETHRARLEAKYNLNTSMGLLMKMPRRMGKTRGTAMFVISMALCSPNQTIAVFAPVISTAQEFVRLCHTVAQELHGGNAAIQRPTSKEELHIRCRNGGVNRIKAYSSVAAVSAFFHQSGMVSAVKSNQCSPWHP